MYLVHSNLDILNKFVITFLFTQITIFTVMSVRPYVRPLVCHIFFAQSTNVANKIILEAGVS